MKTFTRNHLVKKKPLCKPVYALIVILCLSVSVSQAQVLDSEGFDSNGQVSAFAKDYNSLPVGSVVAIAGEARPIGYILCDGRDVSSNEFPELYAVIKNTYGGTSPGFKVPDLRGLFLRGWSSTNTSNDPDRTARTGGNNIGSRQADGFKSHNHTMGSAGSHFHRYTRLHENGNGNEPIANDGKDKDAYYQNWTTDTAGMHIHPINNNGGNETRPENIYVAYWIKATNKVSVAGDIYSGGKIGLGVASPAEKLDVNGNIKANRVILNVGTFPDYVFNDGYDLMKLADLEAYIKTNKHLPKMPTEEEVKKHGADLGQINQVLVEKVEELTLYTIGQQKEIQKLTEELETIKGLLKQLLNK